MSLDHDRHSPAGPTDPLGSSDRLEAIPIINISDAVAAWSGDGPADTDTIDSLAAEIDGACRNVGFFAITGHGLADGLRAEVIDAARAFFTLPNEVKQRVSIADSPNNRGYAEVAGERLQPDLPPDQKETFDIGLERSLSDPSNSPLEGPNQWPDLAGFREPLMTYQAEALAVAKVLLRLMARALQLPDSFFDERTVRPLVNMRLIRYPGPPTTDGTGTDAGRETGSAEAINDLGAGAHSDYGCLTLLYSDGTPGLQLQRLDGSWMDITVPPQALIVNLGDLLQRWTNDRYRSTKHRVNRPTDGDRYSVPVFVNPEFGVEVTCVESCCGPDSAPRYEPILAGDYLQSRFDETFVYRADR